MDRSLANQQSNEEYLGGNKPATGQKRKVTVEEPAPEKRSKTRDTVTEERPAGDSASNKPKSLKDESGMNTTGEISTNEQLPAPDLDTKKQPGLRNGASNDPAIVCELASHKKPSITEKNGKVFDERTTGTKVKLSDPTPGNPTTSTNAAVPGLNILGRDVGPVGFSMYGLTNEHSPVPLEKAVRLLEDCYDNGFRFWSGSLDYGTSHYNSLHVLNQYFDLHPDHIGEVVVNIKASWEPLSDPYNVSSNKERDGLVRKIKQVHQLTGNRKYITIFSPTRLRPDCKLVEVLRELRYWKDWNCFQGIGFCEVGVKAIECANIMMDIALVEVELSLISPDPVNNGVLDTCKRLGIPVIAGAPLAHGLLTSSPPLTLSDDDPRCKIPRFQGTNYSRNRSLTVGHLGSIANRFFEQRTLSELSLGWIQSQGALAVPSSTVLEHMLQNKTALSEKPQLDGWNLVVLNIRVERVIKATVAGERYEQRDKGFVDYSPERDEIEKLREAVESEIRGMEE